MSGRESATEYMVYGSHISLFTRKLESAMRFYGAPFRQERKTGENGPELESRSGSRQVPVLRTPENWVLADTCPFSNSGTPRIHSTFPASASGPTHHSTPSPKQDSDSNRGPKSPNIAIPMQALPHLLALIVRCIPAFFRSHREQVIVEGIGNSGCVLAQ